MTDRDARDEVALEDTTNGNGKSMFTTNRRGIMKAMALTTAGVAAAGLYIPSALADAPTAEDKNSGGAKTAATFPTTPGFSYKSYNGVNFNPETNANDNGYNTGAIWAITTASDWTIHLDLPNGSIIREIVAFYIDNDAANNLTVNLRQYDPTTQGFIESATFTSSGASAAVRAGTLAISGAGPFPLTVDNTTFVYRVNVFFPNSTTVELVGVRVGYTNAGVLTILPTPDRFIDTRTNVGGVQGPLAANTTKNFQITGRAGENGVVIPDAATAVIGTLTAIGTANALNGSFLTVWPTGALPPVSNVNYGPNSVLATQFTSGLAPGAGGHGYLNVFNRSEADYLLDVVGYIS